jgi:hypothetical protein
MEKSMIHTSILFVATVVATVTPNASAFDGLDTGIGNLYRLSNAKSRSISPENFTGEKGKGGMATESTGKPIRFEEDLKVTIQALGWQKTAEGRSAYLQLDDDISSVAYWYQQEPHAPFPKLPGRDELTIPEQKIKNANKP